MLNAGSAARWGVVRWSGPAGARIFTRSGNTAYPDSTWSDWSAPHEKGTGEPVVSPPGQYLQYRVVLEAKAGSPSPTLGKNIGLGYLPAPLAKEGTEISVDCRGRTAAAVVVKTPFYKRAS